MSVRRCLVLAGVIIGPAVVVVCCASWSGMGLWPTASLAAEAEEGGSSASSLPPLEIDSNAPLLLEEPEPPEAEPPVGPVADNQACYVCHANYQEEPFVRWHANANVPCTECHGASHPHRNDEDNITPPDVMYPRTRVDRNCAECHHEHDVAARKVIACWEERCPERTDPDDIVCTDCHGEHRLPRRTVRWNKQTGELIIAQPGASQPPSAAGQ